MKTRWLDRPRAAGRRGAVRQGLLATFAAVALLCASATAQAAFQLDELMALLARNPSGEARFSEQRTVKGLDAPLVSTGTLSFAAPDRFVRHTLTPRAESMSVDGKIVTLTRGGRSRTMVVDAMPEMEAIVEAVRGTLTGNAASLKLHFKPVVTGNADAWTLELLPTEPRLQYLLSSVRLSGRAAELRTVDMRLADGDRSVMRIEPLSGPGPALVPTPGVPTPSVLPPGVPASKP